MMNTQLNKLKIWYESRQLREKVLFTLLSWSFIYAVFSLLLFQPITNKIESAQTQASKQSKEEVTWAAQIDSLKKIKDTPIYNEWVAHNKSIEKLKKSYQSVLGKPVAEQWKEITDIILQNHPNISIEEVKNSQESRYVNKKLNTDTSSIYQQRMQLTIFGTYANVVDFIKYLEKNLPNIYWNSLNLTVKEYPIATVELEFSVLYEKSV